MKKPDAEDIKSQRMAVACLVMDVLSVKVTVREVLLSFPKGVSDPTLTAVWHALCHFEADEDLRKRDVEYANEQDDYLAMLYEVLSRGEELPQNIVGSYEQFYVDAPIPTVGGLKGLFEQFRRFVNI